MCYLHWFILCRLRERQPSVLLSSSVSHPQKACIHAEATVLCVSWHKHVSSIFFFKTDGETDAARAGRWLTPAQRCDCTCSPTFVVRLLAGLQVPGVDELGRNKLSSYRFGGEFLA